MQIRWIPSHQKQRKGETLEETLNREANDAADEVAVEARKQAEPPHALRVKVDGLRKYVHEFLHMAAEMVILQGKDGYAHDHDLRETELVGCPDLDDDIEDSEAEEEINFVGKPRNAFDKLLDKDAVARAAMRAPRVDPYEGHYVEIDDLQMNWENAIKQVRKEQAALTFQGTATQRIKAIQERVRLQQSAEDNTESEAIDASVKRRRYIWQATEQQSVWRKEADERRAKANVQRNVGMGVGKDDQVAPEEALHHHLRTGRTDTGQVWVWCEKCGAHSHERVCNLSKPCRGERHCQQKTRLQRGSHPYTGEANVLQPQNLLWADADAARLVNKARRQQEKLREGATETDQASPSNDLEAAWRKHFQEEQDDAVCNDAEDLNEDAATWLLGHMEGW